jgi:hypothetical protein
MFNIYGLFVEHYWQKKKKKKGAILVSPNRGMAKYTPWCQ